GARVPPHHPAAAHPIPRDHHGDRHRRYAERLRPDVHPHGRWTLVLLRSHRELHLSHRLRSDRAPTRLRLAGRRAVRIADHASGRGLGRGGPLAATSDSSDAMSNSFTSAQIDDSGPSLPRALHVAQNPSPTVRRPRVRRGRTLLARPGNLLVFLGLLLAAILWIYPFI